MKRKDSFVFIPLEKLAKYTLWSAFFIVFLILTNFFTQIVNARLMIEIATSALAILVSAACLLHIHEEHEIIHRKEVRLKNDLIDKIFRHYRHLPQKSIISKSLERKLEKKSNPLQRINLLKRYHENSKELESLVRWINQKNADQEILKDLGLSW